MGFKDMVSGGLADAKAMAETAGDKTNQLLTEYRNATRQLEPLGFSVGKLSVGMGLLPEVHTSLVADVAAVDTGKLTVLMNEKKDDKLLSSLLKALILAKQVHARVESTLKTMTLQVTLGLPPSIGVDFR